MALHPAVAIHLNEICAAAERYGIAKLEIFGSAMTSAFDPDRSDVDFIVHYPPGYDYGPFGKHLFDLEDEITQILGREAQLIMTSALKKESFRESANLTRTVVYDSAPLDASASGRANSLSVHH